MVVNETTRKTSKPRRKTTTRTPSAALADISLKDDQLLTTVQAAALVGLSPKSLRMMKCEKTGPRCLKLGTKQQSRTLYRRSDLEAWVCSRIVSVHGG